MSLLRDVDPGEELALSSDVWLTPIEIIEKLGPFDLDVSAWEGDPTRCAARGYTVHDDGLAQEWSGRVWMNPPYSNVEPWMQRLAEHGDGIALVHVQSCAEWFHKAMQSADTCLLVRHRILFLRPAWIPKSKKGNRPAYASALFAWGAPNVARVVESGMGTFFRGHTA